MYKSREGNKKAVRKPLYDFRITLRVAVGRYGGFLHANRGIVSENREDATFIQIWANSTVLLLEILYVEPFAL